MNRSLILTIAVGTLLCGATVGFADEVKDFHAAVMAADMARVKAILSASPELLNAKSKDGQTALHAAVLAQDPAVVEFLLGKGVDVNAADERQNRPLHVAANSLRADTAALLLKGGADVNVK